MSVAFGLDFGTTNSLITVILPDLKTGKDIPYPLLQDGRPHPSVVWYPGIDTPIVGQKAKDQCTELGLGVFGDIVRSPKMFLGLSRGVHVGGVTREAEDVAADVLRFLRNEALELEITGNPFNSAVITIPVKMDGRARAELRQAARKAGFDVRQFIHEPLAALYGYLRRQENFRGKMARLEGRLVLVFDWGGGTVDLTLCQFRDGVLTQVANHGDREIGGDRFDESLVRLVKEKHGRQHPDADWNRLQPTAEARLIQACEDAKIDLSSRERTPIFCSDILAVPGPEKDISLELTADELREAVRDLIRQGLNQISAVLDLAGLSRGDVEFCLATGGMVEMPAIRNGLSEIFGMDRLRFPESPATVISEGAAWIAHDNVAPLLAKPIELLVANDHYIKLMKAGQLLPQGKNVSQKMNMYCVDPSDGFAKFLFARPERPGREAHGDERLSYACLTLPVDRHSKPLFERLDVEIQIDQDLICTIQASSSGTGKSSLEEIYDLEFGLRMP